VTTLWFLVYGLFDLALVVLVLSALWWFFCKMWNGFE